MGSNVTPLEEMLLKSGSPTSVNLGLALYSQRKKSEKSEETQVVGFGGVGPQQKPPRRIPKAQPKPAAAAPTYVYVPVPIVIKPPKIPKKFNVRRLGSTAKAGLNREYESMLASKKYAVRRF